MTSKDMRKNSLFTATRGWGNVVLNSSGRPRQEFGVYASAYHRAAHTLLEVWRGKNGYNDIDGCVVFFLYRHAIELQLKAILSVGSGVLRLRERPDVAPYMRKHKLLDLAADVERVFEAMNWNWDPEFEVGAFTSQRAFRAFLEDLDAIDPGSHAFRYPVDGKGNASVRRAFTANVFVFAEAIDPVLETLDAAESAIQDAWQAGAESQAVQPAVRHATAQRLC